MRLNVRTWNGYCGEAGFSGISGMSNSIFTKQVSCSSDLCNSLEKLKYLENATLCSDGFYSNTTVNSIIPTTPANGQNQAVDFFQNVDRRIVFILSSLNPTYTQIQLATIAYSRDV